jgi:AraC-like DNA-binding protein
LVINGSFYADFGRTAVIQLLDHRKAEFDALLCSNDYVAVTAIQELKRRGLRVPQDIIITGYDNIHTCRHIHMPLTTVHQPCFELGYQAAEYLCSLLDGNKNQTSIELPSRFIARQSCGCKEQEATTEYINMQSSSSGIRLNMLDITLSGFKKKITNIMHFHELEETMYQSFPQFAVKSCFIFVYDAAKTAHTSVSPMLLLGYENYKLLDAGSHNVRVVPEQIIPFCKQRINRQDIVYIYALVHGEKLLGHAVYAIDAKEDTYGISTRYNDGSLCELLTQELAATLNSVNDYKKCKKVENTGSNVQHTLNSNYSNGYKLSGDQEEQYFNSIISFMEKEKPYINDDLSLYDLARETDIPRSYLSYVINKYAGVNFYDFLHKYRVKEAKTILSDKRYNDLRILEIAYNCGFKAKSTFNKIFKKQTGMTPSDFKKQKKILVKG